MAKAQTTFHSSRQLPPSPMQRVPAWFRVLGIMAVLYVFLASIGLMGHGFKAMGRDFAQQLIQTTSNPFIGLFVGILATSVVQSSSLTTSIVVGMVSAGTLTVQGAIPIVMGANIGTTVTCLIVSLGFIGRKREFRRAFHSSTVHDVFNFLCVLVLFPIELVTQHAFGVGFLEWLGGHVGELFVGAKEASFASPVKAATKPLVTVLEGLVKAAVGEGSGAAWVQVGLSFVLLFAALWAITKLMRSLMLGKVESVLDRTVGRNAALGLVVGVVVTAVIQSSSITTSILVPLAAAGIVTVDQVFPITVGANIGTTVTALLASLGGSPAGLHIALVHLLFNSTGTLIFLPLRPLRRIPIALAGLLAKMTTKSRWYAVVYVAVLFFLIPALLIFLT
jgi:sodium-dependent phosphate cotransporter